MLTGSKILEEVENGGIQITPFDKSQLNPNSYNVRLGGTLKVYTSEKIISIRALNFIDILIYP